METESLVLEALAGAERVAQCTLGNEPVTVGAWAGATLRVQSETTLPVELVLDPDGTGRARLLALGATGCLVNGERRRRATVHPGDLIELDGFIIRVADMGRSEPPLVVESPSPRKSEQALGATVSWRGQPLDARTLLPSETLTLGGLRATFDVPLDAGLCVPVASCLDGVWHVALDAGGRAFDVTDGRLRPILCASPRTDGPRAGRGKGGLWAPIPDGARIRLLVGDVALELARTTRELLPTIERTPLWRTPEGERAIVLAMFVALLIGILHNPPPAPYRGDNPPQAPFLRERVESIARKTRLETTFTPPRLASKNEAQGGAKAKGDEGQMGRPDATGKGKRAGPLSDAEVVRQNELLRVLGGVTGRASGGGALAAASSIGRLDGEGAGDGHGNFGLGLRGTGSGGGGLSGDSIGVGPVGTQGVGAGAGRGRVKAQTASELGIDEPASVRGGLDREVIRRVILSHRAQIRYCYEKELADRPDLAGRVLVEFVIGADGRVTTARAAEDSLQTQAVGRCVVARVKGWTFPKPEGGGVVVVTYPFLFKPAGQGDAP